MSDIKFIKSNLKSLAITGLWDYWSYPNSFYKKLFKTYGIIVSLYYMCHFVTVFTEMINLITDIPLFMENATITLLSCMTLVKNGTLLFRKEKIESLLEQMRIAERNAYQKNKKQISIYEASIGRAQLFSKAYWIMCFSMLIGFLIERPVEFIVLGPQEAYHNRLRFLFSAWFPFDVYNVDRNFIVAYAFQVSIGILGDYFIAVTDSFIISMMIFAIGQFEMIQDEIKNLGEAEVGELVDVSGKIADIVQHHCSIIDYLKELDDLINPIIFINFLICSLMICSCCLEGIMSGASVRLILSIQFLITLLGQLFAFYWHGNEIILESSNIGGAVSESNWFKFDLKSKKALLLILCRSQRPCVLSVGGFYEMSLNTFVMILQATYSFVTVFQQLYSRE